MDTYPLQPVLDALGAEFGSLDNTAEKWAALAPNLQAHLPTVRAVLEEHFPTASAPLRIFHQGAETYQSLLAEIEQSGQPDAATATAAGYLNLRFYIYLSGFLAACRESLEKCAYNDGLDPAELVEKSYYRPYFFARAVFSTDEMIAMLEDDLAQLHAAPRDKKGILLAVRIRKGIVSTLAESYCPTHPLFYPWVQQLEGIPTQNSTAMIDVIITTLETIRGEILYTKGIEERTGK